MKLPPNVWETQLEKDDWNFGKVPKSELPRCLEHELRREKVQSEAGGCFPSTIEYAATDKERELFRKELLRGDRSESVRDMLDRLNLERKGPAL